MKGTEREALEARGHWVGDADEFLGLEPYESAIIDLRLAIARGIREARAKGAKTQAELARASKSSPGRVALAEAGSPRVSVELMIRTLYAAGGDLSVIRLPNRPATPPQKEPSGGQEAKAVAPVKVKKTKKPRSVDA